MTQYHSSNMYKYKDSFLIIPQDRIQSFDTDMFNITCGLCKTVYLFLCHDVALSNSWVLFTNHTDHK
jgi:hypothetical protein